MNAKRPTGEALAAALADRIGHVFADGRLAETALTHSSAAGTRTSNERLEFLGDRVLGLIVTDLLYQMHPDAPQGELAVRFSQLVSGDTCAAIASEIGIDALVRVDAGLRANGGRKAKNVLGDAMEALVAAVYLDGGMEAARAAVLRLWEPRARMLDRPPRDAKTELQEWAVRFDGARPVYTIEGREGPDHEPVFTVRVSVEGFAPAEASGKSKQAAERAAAAALLAREGVWAEEEATA
ncbi:MAG: ribonuclease III [Rhizobiaceae bacterium]